MTEIILFKGLRNKTTNNNKMIFLEIAARAGGAYILKLYKKHLNLDFYESNLLLQIDSNYDLNFKEKGPYSACLWFPSQTGIVHSFNTPILKSQYQINFFVEPGQSLERSATLQNKIAEVFLWNNNFTDLYIDFNNLKRFKMINYVSDL